MLGNFFKGPRLATYSASYSLKLGDSLPELPNVVLIFQKNK